MMMASFSRQLALMALPFLALVACGAANGAGGKTPAAAEGKPAAAASVVDGELGHVKGNPDAPITLIEYASPTCGACKYWHDEVQPTIEEKYIATGKVKFVYREYPLNGIDVMAYSLSRCVASENFFPMIDKYFENQAGVIQAAQNNVAKTALLTIGQEFGIKDMAQLDACANDPAIRQQLADVYATAEEYAVGGTPTFVVDGKVRSFEGDYRTAEGFSKQLDLLLAEKGVK
jgi:protein-disulfide isomerase